VRFSFRPLFLWIRNYWGEWRVVKVPPPPEVRPPSPPPHSPRYRALTAIPSAARRGKGPSTIQRLAQKRRVRLQSLKGPQ
jgi:hypothetical protein